MKKTNYILITGASRGIGKSAALLFARRGWHVFLNCARSIDELEKTAAEIRSCPVETTPDDDESKPLFGSCTLVPGDVGDPGDVRRIFETIDASCSALDVLINNAGISHTGLLTDMSDSEWNRLLAANLSSAFYCCRSAVPPMVFRKKGKIINISSMWGRVGASCEAAYSASKAGMQGLTMALAKELAPSNIQVNAIACGVIDTAMNGHLSPEEKASLADDIPAGRFGTPGEVAELIWDLAHAPAYLTGQIIGIDGGYI